MDKREWRLQFGILSSHTLPVLLNRLEVELQYYRSQEDYRDIRVVSIFPDRDGYTHTAVYEYEAYVVVLGRGGV